MATGPNRNKRGTRLVCPTCGKKTLTDNSRVKYVTDPRGICLSCKAEFGTTFEEWMTLYHSQRPSVL